MQYLKQINLFHIFFVAPLFIYIGYQKQNTPNWLFNVLIAIGVIVLAYHAYRYMS